MKNRRSNRKLPAPAMGGSPAGPSGGLRERVGFRARPQDRFMAVRSAGRRYFPKKYGEPHGAGSLSEMHRRWNKVLCAPVEAACRCTMLRPRQRNAIEYRNPGFQEKRT